MSNLIPTRFFPAKASGETDEDARKRMVAHPAGAYVLHSMFQKSQMRIRHLEEEVQRLRDALETRELIEKDILQTIAKGAK